MITDNYKHGYIGIGATGLQGIQGNAGRNFYIDKIDNFFTYITDTSLIEYGLSNKNISILKNKKVLNPKYKSGDILYILNDSSVVYKAIELTDNHILCDENYLKNSSYISYPFSYQFLDILNPSILHFPLNIANNSNKSIFNMHDRYNNALINGTAINTSLDINVSIDGSVYYDELSYSYIPDRYIPDTSNILKYINIVNNGAHINAYTNSSDYSIPLLKLDNNKSDLLNINATTKYIDISTRRNLKISNLYIKNKNKGNVEALNTLYDLNLLLDIDGHCYTLNATDYDVNTLRLIFDKSKYFKNIPDNIDEYKIGYIHTMYNYNKDNTYHSNYIKDISIINTEYKDIKLDNNGAYVRDWTILNNINELSIRDLLINYTTDTKLNDISNLLPDTINSSILEQYLNSSIPVTGIIETSIYKKDIEYSVLVRPDLSLAYYHSDIKNVSDFILKLSDNTSIFVSNDYTLGDISKDDISDMLLDKSIKDSSNTIYYLNDLFDTSYNSSILYGSNTSYIDIMYMDDNIMPYVHHNIITWIHCPNGFKYYSNNIDITYDISVNNFDISTMYQSFIDNLISIESNNSTEFTYTINGGTLYISNITDDITINNIYINNLNIGKRKVSNNTITYQITDTNYYTIDTSKFIENPSILELLYNNTVSGVNNYNIPVTVEYTKNNEILYDYYSIKSAGYDEIRKLPEIKLHIYDDIDSLETFNSVDKGILSNQFQCFMKVSVTDFNKDNWGKLFDNVCLNFKLSANNSDGKNIIESYTYDGLKLGNSIYYTKLAADIDIYNITVKEINEYGISTDLSSIDLSVNANNEQTHDFYIRILIEQENPVPSIYHFAYAIDEITINKSTLSINGLYKSNHLYTTIIPISMTAEYDRKNMNINTSGLKMFGPDDFLKISIYPYKMNEVLLLYMDKYTREIMSVDEYTLYKKLNWNSYQLKNRYFQDNIESVNITPININDIYQNLPENMYDTNWLNKDTDDIYYSYLSIAYDVTNNSMLMNDEEVFYYNNNMYLASLYTLIPNNTAVFIELSIIKDIRSKNHIESLAVWNTEYQKLYHKDSDMPFTGHLSVYGNGYQYIGNDKDYNQYIEDDIISLLNLKTIMELDIFEDNLYTVTLDVNNNQNNYSPGILFSSLLKMVKWAYPKYKTVNGLNLIDSMDVSAGILTNSTIDSNYMPYNLMYSIYPRVTFNDETLMHNILMLRKPSVIHEDNYKFGNVILDNPLNDLTS